MFNLKSKLFPKHNEPDQPKQTKKLDPSFGSSSGYKVSNSYLKSGRRLIAYYDIIFDYGSNGRGDKDVDIGWTTRVIPSRSLKHGDVRFIQRQRPLSKSEENKIIDSRLVKYGRSFSKNTMDESNARAKTQGQQRSLDFKLASALSADPNEIVVDSDMQLLVLSDSPEDIELTVAELTQSYRDSGVYGITFIRYTGTQLSKAKSIISDVSSDNLHPTDMGLVSAGRLFAPSSGFSDMYGSFIGTDIQSFIQPNRSIMDARNIHNAIIYGGGAIPQVNYLSHRKQETMYDENGAWATWLAEKSTWLMGQRTHFIVLNDFNFKQPDNLVFDMSTHSINPLEVFSSGKDNLVSDVNNNVNKLIEMCLLLMKISDDNSANNLNSYVRNDIRKYFMEYLYFNANGVGMYSKDPLNNPTQARRILAKAGAHDTYPVMNDFLTYYQTQLGSMNESQKKERTEFILNSLRSMAESNSTVFNQPTTLPDQFTKDKRNIYYDLSGLGQDQTLKGAMFMNTLAYVTNRALPNEQVVIIGMDSVVAPPDILGMYREVLDRKGIGLITSFDKRNNKNLNPLHYEPLVKNFSRQDLVMVGNLDSDEIVQDFNKLWNNRQFPEIVINELRAGAPHRYFIWRKEDGVTAVVDTEILL